MSVEFLSHKTCASTFDLQSPSWFQVELQGQPSWNHSYSNEHGFNRFSRHYVCKYSVFSIACLIREQGTRKGKKGKGKIIGTRQRLSFWSKKQKRKKHKKPGTMKRKLKFQDHRFIHNRCHTCGHICELIPWGGKPKGGNHAGNTNRRQNWTESTSPKKPLYPSP